MSLNAAEIDYETAMKVFNAIINEFGFIVFAAEGEQPLGYKIYYVDTFKGERELPAPFYLIGNSTREEAREQFDFACKKFPQYTKNFYWEFSAECKYFHRYSTD